MEYIYILNPDKPQEASLVYTWNTAHGENCRIVLNAVTIKFSRGVILDIITAEVIYRTSKKPINLQIEIPDLSEEESAGKQDKWGQKIPLNENPT